MTELYGNQLPPEFNDGNKLTAAEFNAVKNYWVTDELPEDAPDTPEDEKIQDGDVVFVIESDPVGGGLPGIGGWATIEEVTGTYKNPRYEYNDGPGGVGGTDWVAYEWTDDGTVKTSGGLVDALIVGGGGSGGGATDSMGGGPGCGGAGAFRRDIAQLSGTVDVVVGAGGVGSNSSRSCYDGENSSLGNLVALGGGRGALTNSGTSTINPGASGGGSAYLNGGRGISQGMGNNGGSVWNGSQGGGGGGAATPAGAAGQGGDGFIDSITGEPVGYAGGGWCNAAGAPPVDFGAGHSSNGTSGRAGSGSGGTAQGSGGSGVVIIRVPKEYAPSVQENRHGWLNHATVEDGVVTSVNKTPDNLPYEASADEVPCGPEVAEGWNYDGSEFVAPEPDYSDQIKQLEETLQTLRGAK
jgi:hypothetical protein